MKYFYLRAQILRRIIHLSLIVLFSAAAHPTNPILAADQTREPAASNSGQWTSGGPYGGYVKSLAISQINPDIMYARTTGSVYRTEDGGSSWTETNFPQVEPSILYEPGSPEIAIFPDNDDVVYTGSYRDGIYKSEDGGETWTCIGFSGQKVNTIAIDPNSADTLYIGTGDWFSGFDGEIIGIFKSTDGGESWQRIDQELEWDQVNSLLVDPSDSSNIYAGGHASGYFGCFLKSTDGGGTWTDVAFTGNTGDTVTALVMPPAWYSTQVIYALGTGDEWGVELYKSTDRGDSWVKIYNPYAYFPQDGKALAVDPVSPQWVFVGTDDDDKPLFAYNDDEDQWYYFDEPGLPSHAPSCVVVHPQVTFGLFLGFAEDGLYKLSGTGGYWILSNTGINNACINGLAVDPTSSDTAFAAVDDFSHSLARTADSGTSWEYLAHSPGNIRAVSISQQNPQNVFVGKYWQGAGWWEDSVDFYINESTDGGENWIDRKFATCTGGGDCYTSIADILVDAGDPDCIIVAATPIYSPYSGLTGEGLHARTTNHGASWSQLLYEVSSTALAADPNSPDIVYSGKIRTAQVFRFTNVWGDWTADEITPAGGMGNVQDIEMDENSFAYVATDEGLMRWNGSSWIKLSGLPDEDITSLAIDRGVNADIIFAGTGENGVFISQDGGSTWETFNDGLGSFHITKLALSKTHPRRLYAGTENRGAWSIDVSSFSGVFELTIQAGSGGITDPMPGSYDYGYGTEVVITAVPDSNYKFNGWTGDVPAGHENDNPLTITMDEDKSITANFQPSGGGGGTGDGDGGAKKGGCFIATAAYGFPLHPYLEILRDFRDRFLMSSKPGRVLVNTYYKYSPFLADLIAKNKALKVIVQINLLPIIAISYSLLHFGPIITTVIFVSIFMLPFFFILRSRRRFRQTRD